MKKNYDQLARVVQIVDEYTLVINRGSEEGVQNGDRFLIFRVGDDIVDPATNENLGPLEIVVGRAEAVHTQERICTIKSYENIRSSGQKRIIRRSGGVAIFGTSVEEVEEDPRSERSVLDANVGDFAKPI